MNAAIHDPLRARVQALEQEIKLLRQGMQQATRMRQLWEQAIEDLRETKQRLDFCDARTAMLCTISEILAEDGDLAHFLARALDAIARLAEPAPPVAMGIFLREQDHMRLAVSRGAADVFVNGRWESDLLPLAALENAGLLCLPGEAGTAPVSNPTPGAMHGRVAVPLTARGRCVGFLGLLPSSADAFDLQLGESLVAAGRLIGLGIATRTLPDPAIRKTVKTP